MPSPRVLPPSDNHCPSSHYLYYKVSSLPLGMLLLLLQISWHNVAGRFPGKCSSNYYHLAIAVDWRPFPCRWWRMRASIKRVVTRRPPRASGASGQPPRTAGIWTSSITVGERIINALLSEPHVNSFLTSRCLSSNKAVKHKCWRKLWSSTTSFYSAWF